MNIFNQKSSIQSANRLENPSFLLGAIAWKNSITPRVIGYVAFFVAYSIFITFFIEDNPKIQFNVGPFEISGAIIGVLLVFRLNAGYERWWEARRLWGGIVNQCRNLAVAGVVYGSQSPQWKLKFVRCVIAVSYLTRDRLRNGESAQSELILDEVDRDLLLNLDHKPIRVIQIISQMIEEGRTNGDIDPYLFLQLENQRSLLLDHLGGCERILNTPIPLIVSIKIRRFILLFLLFVPFILSEKVGNVAPIMMFLISYPLLSLERIGFELQNPFSTQNSSHLPLDEICLKVEKNIMEVYRSHSENGLLKKDH